MSPKKTFSFLRRKDRSRVVDGVPPPLRARVLSLGSGTLSADGCKLIEFTASPSKGGDESTGTRTRTSSNSSLDRAASDLEEHKTRNYPLIISEKIIENAEKIKGNIEQIPKIIQERLRITPTATFKRLSSTFIRVSDLQMTRRYVDGVHESESFPNFHTPHEDPPPGVDRDPDEEWVALDNGAGAAAPIAPYAVAALASFGHKTAMNQTMWKSEGKTDRMLNNSGWGDIVWQTSGKIKIPQDFEEEVMVWTGNFVHGKYGSDLPAIRSTGIVNMSPKALCDLLSDSGRVKEYNKMSLGRTDLLVLQDNLDEEQATPGPFGRSITKVMISESQPPLIRRNLQFVSILHATALEDGGGYLIVTRAVTQASDGGGATTASVDFLRSEILIGVNVIRPIEGHDDRCLMINVNHIRTPMVPLFIGKRIGLAAAPGFIRDLRSINTVHSA